MASRAEVLVFGCREDDLATLTKAFGPTGPHLSVVESTAQFARDAVSRQPLAGFLGVGRDSTSNLDVIPLIHAVRKGLPVIVIAEDDSLALERSARQTNLFYFLIHPIEPSEVKAVLRDLLRHAGGRPT